MINDMVNRELRKAARVWASAAYERGMNYALTVNPDIHPDPSEDPRKLINGLSRALFKELNRSLRGMGARQAEREVGINFLGVYELHNQAGVLYPHAHFALKLEEEDAFRLPFVMRERWGDKVTVGGKDVYRPAEQRPLSGALGRQAQWLLKPTWGLDGWARYLHKELTEEATQLDVYPHQFIRKVA